MLHWHTAAAVSVSLVCVHTWLPALVLRVLTGAFASRHSVVHWGTYPSVQLATVQNTVFWEVLAMRGEAETRNAGLMGKKVKFPACKFLYPIMSPISHNFHTFLKIP